MIGVLLSLLFLASIASVGVAVLGRIGRCLFRPWEQIVFGAPLGVVLGSFALLLLSLLLGFAAPAIALTGALCLAGTLLLRGDAWSWTTAAGGLWPAPWRHRHRAFAGAVTFVRCRLGVFPVLTLSGLTLLWAIFYADMVTYRDGALWVSQIHLWSDLSVHLGQITSFAYAGNVPPQNPFYAGEPLVYHYLISLTTAAMVTLGMTPLPALRLHDLLLTVAVTLAIFALARRLTGNRNAAALAVLLFMLGSGLGWLLTAGEINGSRDLIGTLRERAWDYTAAEGAGIRWEPVFLVAIAPTRGTLYGLALGALTLAALFQAVQQRQRRLFLLAGAVAGLLPLAHMGTLLALAMITPILVILFPSRRWLLFFGIWVALAAPQLYLEGGLSGGTGRIHQDLGWMADKENAVWFWLTNLGLFLPLLALAWFDRGAVPAPARRFLWAFMPIFVVANVVALDPTGPWNNLKVLVYWFLAVCILVGGLIARAWREQRTLVVRSLLLGAVLTMVLSSLLMHLHVALGKNSYMLFSSEERQVARWAREQTPADAVFASGLQANPVVTALAGRRTLLFFTPYLVSWGIDPAQRERDLRAIYALAPNAAELLQRYDVSFVVVGPWERDGLRANVAAFRARFPLAMRAGDNEVFDVRGVASEQGAGAVAAVGEPQTYPPRSEGECVRALSGGPTYQLRAGRRRIVPDDETRRAIGCTAVWPWQDWEIARIPEDGAMPAAP